MHAGATLSRRFTLLRPDSYDLPGAQRWIARDERLSGEVYVDLLRSSTPGVIRQAAVRAAQVRDLRFTRVLATGRELLGDSRVTYVATEAPTGVPLTRLINQRIVPAVVAAAIIGEAAHALQAAAKLGVHHGFLRSDAVHVADTGRVVLSGLATDGHLAFQADLADSPSEMADARALARLHLALVTGMVVEEATVTDLPVDLSPRAANLARATIAGNEPTTLAELSRIFSSADARVLRDVSHTMTSWPWVPGAEPAPLPPIARLGMDVALTSDTMHRSELIAGLALVKLHATPQLAATVQAGAVARLVPAPEVPDSVTTHPAGYTPATAEEVARFSAATRRAAARDADKELGLDTWETIATEQNRAAAPSVVQAVLEWLHRRWPRSVSLGTAVEQARHRAHRPAPLTTGPVLVAIFLALTLVAGIVSFEILTAPMNATTDEDVEPPSHYPEFTYSPEPLPSPSPEGEEAGTDQTDADAQGDD